jgi:hypothetical protein
MLAGDCEVGIYVSQWDKPVTNGCIGMAPPLLKYSSVAFTVVYCTVEFFFWLERMDMYIG